MTLPDYVPRGGDLAVERSRRPAATAQPDQPRGEVPEHQRVGALSFVPQALVMPVTYGLLTPLALFTLDSGSWETRGHGAGTQTGRHPV